MESQYIEKLDKLTEAVAELASNQAVTNNQIETISETLRGMTKILDKQVELETNHKNIKRDVNSLYEKIRTIDNNGTRLCSQHNAQFEKMFGECKTIYQGLKSWSEQEIAQTTKEIDEIKQIINDRDQKAFRFFLFLATPLYGGIISLIFWIVTKR